MTKHLICTNPFQHMEVVEHGDYKIYQCCSGMLTTPTGLAYDKLKRTWNNETAQAIRTSVLDGTFKYCKSDRCFDLANITNSVKYVDDNELNYWKDQISNNGPTFVNLAYDQSCNLRCPSCRTDIRMANKEQRQFYSELLTKILTSFDTIQTLHITGGGDPFASRHFWDFLCGEELLKYPNLNLYIMTNGQLFNQYHWNKLSHIHNKIKTIHVSIDAACEQTYLLNRAPGKWDVLLNNMKFISELKQQFGFKLTTAFVIQQNNWRELIDFINLSKSWDVNSIHLAPIANWYTFSSEEYYQRAVHYNTHPEYNEFMQTIKIIQDLNDPRIDLTGNIFTNLIPLIQVS